MPASRAHPRSALFLIQSRGTAQAWPRSSGRSCCSTSSVIGVLGMLRHRHATAHPRARSIPAWALNFFLLGHGMLAFLALGSVVLAVTGAEALYADMGHFGRRSIQRRLALRRLPGLMLNYLGQAALLLADPTADRQSLLPAGARVGAAAARHPLDGRHGDRQPGRHHWRLLARAAGDPARPAAAHAGSRTQSRDAEGQIFIPRVNRMLLIGVLLLVLLFKNSSALASAYGIAVTGTMVVTTASASWSCGRSGTGRLGGSGFTRLVPGRRRRLPRGQPRQDRRRRLGPAAARACVP